MFAVQIMKSNISTSFLLEHAFEMLKDQHAPRSCYDRESLFHPQDEKTTANNVAFAASILSAYISLFATF